MASNTTPLRLLALVLAASTLAEGVMVCYYGSWAVYRWGEGKFDVEDIDPTICTHAVFGFAGLDSQTNEIKVLDPYNELCDNWGKCAYDRFVALKDQNPNLKVLLAVGGWNEGSAKYSHMAADPAKRKVFIESSVSLLLKHGFDGFDMDWEYPTQRDGDPQDWNNFVTLLAELRVALQAEGMLLTAAVAAGKSTVDSAYDVPAMSAQLDLINLMAYDLHGPWDPYTHHQSPLYGHPLDQEDDKFLNVDYAVSHWLEKGAPKDKLVLGLALYGRCWSLDSETQHGFYAPGANPGNPGPWTGSPGFMGYNEICYRQLAEPWTVVHDPVMNEPYAYYMPNSRIWCGYEDAQSLSIKSQWARDLGLAGTMVWSIETDDFHGHCHHRPYHLIKTIVETFNGGDPITNPPTNPPMSTTTRDPNQSTPPPEPTTSTQAPTTPIATQHCDHPGYNYDNTDCTRFYTCVPAGNGGYNENLQICPDGTLFNPMASVCDWAAAVCALDICPNDCP